MQSSDTQQLPPLHTANDEKNFVRNLVHVQSTTQIVYANATASDQITEKILNFTFDGQHCDLVSALRPSKSALCKSGMT